MTHSEFSRRSGAVLCSLAFACTLTARGDSTNAPVSTNSITPPMQSFTKPPTTELKKKLDPLQYQVTQQCGSVPHCWVTWYCNGSSFFFSSVVGGLVNDCMGGVIELVDTGAFVESPRAVRVHANASEHKTAPDRRENSEWVMTDNTTAPEVYKCREPTGP